MSRAASPKTRRPATERPLATALREIVRKRGLTAYGLGKLSGVDPGVISRFLSGERDVTLATADRLASALGLRLAELAHRTRRASGGPAPGPPPASAGPSE